MRRSRYFGVALFGLLVVAAISVAAGSGRKPATENSATSVRMLTAVEAAQVRQRFPELRTQGICQIGSGLLGQLFPSTDFYKVYSEGAPPYPYLIAISGNALLTMPEEFNRVLSASGLEVTDENIVYLAKSFVLLAVGNEPTVDRSRTWGHPGRLDTFPPVTFLDAKRMKQEISRITFDAKLKVRIGEQVEEWYFASWHGQLGLVSRGTTDGKLIKQYDLPRAESPLQRGQLDVTPSIDICTSAPSKAYVEWQGATPHYYLIVDSNGVASSFQVRCSLSGFPPNATNVFVRVEDTIRNLHRLLDTVHIDGQGVGTYDWPPPDSLTGICKVEADTLGPDSVYRNATGLPRKELTLGEFRGHNKKLSLQGVRLVFPWSVWAGLLRSEAASGRLFQAGDELVIAQWSAGAVVQA
jgi:hypothetical protein